MAQNPINTFTSSTYIGGYHIKCNGQSTGSIKAQPSFGTAPYTFLWSSGETSAQINNKPAGIYIVTITDSINVSHSDTFELRQPNALNYQSTLSDYYGYNIHTHNGNSGSIHLSGTGGTPPYTYLWSNGDSLATRKDLTAGNYNFSITDANQCSTSGNVTLTAPTAIQLSFTNVQNTQCDRSEDGAATLNMSGGLGNFSVVWSNGSFSLSPNDLPAGYNEVRIYEQGKAIIDTGITINAPQQLEVAFTLSQYANGYHVSCVDCYNGSITTTVTGGTAPYTYLWEDENSSTTANLSNLNGGEYGVKITDAHGCKTGDGITLKMPSPKDWSRFGNSNIDTAEFIGSTDTSAVVFKTNSQEALRLAGNGNVGLGTNSPTEKLEVNGNLKVNGEIKIGSLGAISYNDGAGIRGYKFEDFSNLNIGNIQPSLPGCFSNLPNLYNSFTGLLKVSHPTLSTTTSTYIGNDVEGGLIESANDFNSNISLNLRINYFCGNDVLVGNSTSGNLIANNRVGVGTTTPSQKLEINHNDLSGGIALNKSSNDISNKSEIKFNKNNNQLFAIGCDFYNNGKQSFFIWDHVASSAPFIINEYGKIGIGGVYPPTNSGSIYKLYVEGGIVTRDIKVTAGAFPDYVFSNAYNLMPINDLSEYIKINRHLPGLLSAEEIEKNEGFEVGEMQRKLLEKVEEQTLYIIALQKQIDDLKVIVENKKEK